MFGWGWPVAFLCGGLVLVGRQAVTDRHGWLGAVVLQLRLGRQARTSGAPRARPGAVLGAGYALTGGPIVATAELSTSVAARRRPSRSGGDPGRARGGAGRWR